MAEHATCLQIHNILFIKQNIILKLLYLFKIFSYLLYSLGTNIHLLFICVRSIGITCTFKVYHTCNMNIESFHKCNIPTHT